MDHSVLYGAGNQTLKHIPIDRNGKHVVVTSPTYTIVDLREGRTSSQREIVASTAATIDTASDSTTTTVGRSATNPQLIGLGDASEFTVGRRYLISDGAGSELFTIEAIDTNTLYSSKALQGDYCANASVVAIELEATFPASEADSEDETVEDGGGPYQIIWSYSIDGQPYIVPETVWVNRYSYTPWITREDLLRGHAQIDQRASREAISDALIVATEEVAAELQAGGLDPSKYRSTQVGRIAVRYRALHYIFMGFHGDQDSELADSYGERYKMHMSQILINGPERALVVRDDVDQPDAIDLSRNKLFTRP